MKLDVGGWTGRRNPIAGYRDSEVKKSYAG